MDREDGFERGFIAGWKARGEHEDGLRNRAEEALDELRSQLPDVAEEDEIHRRWAQVGQAFCKNCGFPAKTCVCVPQQVNQQSWQGATARHDPGHQQTAAFEEVMREDRDILRELAKRKSS